MYHNIYEKHMKHIIIILFLFILSNSLYSQESSSPLLDQKISTTNLFEISQEIIKDNKISNEDIELFAKGIARLGVMNDSLNGKTVGEVIASQKNYLQRVYSKEMFGNAARVQMIMHHQFQYIAVQPQDEGDQKIDLVIFDVANISDKEITNLEGILKLYDKNNNLIKMYHIDSEVSIPVDKTERIGQPFFHDKENPKDEYIRSEASFRSIWQPIEISFSDGSSIK